MLLAVAAFAPAARSSQKHMHVYMKNEMPALNKIIGSAVIASALFGGAVVPGTLFFHSLFIYGGVATLFEVINSMSNWPVCFMYFS